MKRVTISDKTMEQLKELAKKTGYKKSKLLGEALIKFENNYLAKYNEIEEIEKQLKEKKLFLFGH